jgi:mannose-6-phosphate isomerase-like protein (cupin superfamily)
MRHAVAALVFAVFVLWIASAVAQSPATSAGDIKLNPLAATSGHGVSNASLLDQPDVRVSRVDVEPGGVRNVHSHDDVRFHLWIPVSGTFEMEIEPNRPVKVSAWQPQEMKGGTRHGFKNIGTSTGTIVEVFVKK